MLIDRYFVMKICSSTLLWGMHLPIYFCIAAVLPGNDGIESRNGAKVRPEAIDVLRKRVQGSSMFGGTLSQVVALASLEDSHHLQGQKFDISFIFATPPQPIGSERFNNFIGSAIEALQRQPSSDTIKDPGSGQVGTWSTVESPPPGMGAVLIDLDDDNVTLTFGQAAQVLASIIIAFSPVGEFGHPQACQFIISMPDEHGTMDAMAVGTIDDKSNALQPEPERELNWNTNLRNLSLPLPLKTNLAERLAQAKNRNDTVWPDSIVSAANNYNYTVELSPYESRSLSTSIAPDVADVLTNRLPQPAPSNSDLTARDTTSRILEATYVIIKSSTKNVTEQTKLATGVTYSISTELLGNPSQHNLTEALTLPLGMSASKSSSQRSQTNNGAVFSLSTIPRAQMLGLT